MNLRTCDCCREHGFKELNHVEVGKHHVEWFVCADCYNNVIPRMPKDTEVPGLSLLLPFGR